MSQWCRGSVLRYAAAVLGLTIADLLLCGLALWAYTAVFPGIVPDAVLGFGLPLYGFASALAIGNLTAVTAAGRNVKKASPALSAALLLLVGALICVLTLLPASPAPLSAVLWAACVALLMLAVYFVHILAGRLVPQGRVGN